MEEIKNNNAQNEDYISSYKLADKFIANLYESKEKDKILIRIYFDDVNKTYEQAVYSKYFEKSLESLERCLLRREENKMLLEKYPWLRIRNRWTGELIEEDPFFYSNELDCLEEGWRIAFGLDLCRDLDTALRKLSKENYDSFRITQIKEKYGTLRFYTNFTTDEISDVINKYIKKSMEYCLFCGKPVSCISRGWIYYLCDDCGKRYDAVPLSEYEKQLEEDL